MSFFELLDIHPLFKDSGEQKNVESRCSRFAHQPFENSGLLQTA